MNTITNIKVSRCEDVLSSRAVAIIHLNTHAHQIGTPVMVRYRIDDNKIDTITAIGIKNGIGPDCYSITSEGGKIYVADVNEILPDVSSLIHNLQYIAKYNNEWSLIYIDDSGVERRIGPLSEDARYFSLLDGHEYYYVSGKVIRDDNQFDLFSDKLEIMNLGNIELSVTPRSSTTGKKGTTINFPGFDVEVLTRLKENITSSCEFHVYDYQGVEQSISRTGNSIFLNISVGVTSDYMFEAIYRIGNEETKARAWVSFYMVDPILYGTTSDPTNLSEKLWNGRGDLVLDFDLDNTKSLIKVPSDLLVFKHIYDDNGLDYINNYHILLEQNYTVYEKIEPVRINNFRQIFTYQNNVTLVISGFDESSEVISTAEFNQIFTQS